MPPLEEHKGAPSLIFLRAGPSPLALLTVGLDNSLLWGSPDIVCLGVSPASPQRCCAYLSPDIAMHFLGQSSPCLRSFCGFVCAQVSYGPYSQGKPTVACIDIYGWQRGKLRFGVWKKYSNENLERPLNLRAPVTVAVVLGLSVTGPLFQPWLEPRWLRARADCCSLGRVAALLYSLDQACARASPWESRPTCCAGSCSPHSTYLSKERFIFISSIPFILRTLFEVYLNKPLSLDHFHSPWGTGWYCQWSAGNVMDPLCLITSFPVLFWVPLPFAYWMSLADLGEVTKHVSSRNWLWLSSCKNYKRNKTVVESTSLFKVVMNLYLNKERAS